VDAAKTRKNGGGEAPETSELLNFFDSKTEQKDGSIVNGEKI